MVQCWQSITYVARCDITNTKEEIISFFVLFTTPRKQNWVNSLLISINWSSPNFQQIHRTNTKYAHCSVFEHGHTEVSRQQFPIKGRSGTEALVIYCFSVRHRSIAIRQAECNRYQLGVRNWEKPVSFSCIAIAPTMTSNQRWRSLSHSAAWEPHEGRF